MKNILYIIFSLVLVNFSISAQEMRPGIISDEKISDLKLSEEDAKTAGACADFAMFLNGPAGSAENLKLMLSAMIKAGNEPYLAGVLTQQLANPKYPEYEDMVKEALLAAKEHPENAVLNGCVSGILLNLGRRAEALDLLRSSLARSYESKSLFGTVPERKTQKDQEANAILASLYLRVLTEDSKYEEAGTFIKRLDGWPEVKNNLYYLQSLLLYYDKARKQDFPGHAFPLNLFLADRKETAESDFRKTLDLFCEKADAELSVIKDFSMALEIAGKEGKFPGLNRIAEEILHNPCQPQAYGNLSTYYHLTGDRANAFRAMRTQLLFAGQLPPRQLLLYTFALIASGDLTQGGNCLQLCIVRGLVNDQILYSEAVAQHQNGAFDTALLYARRISLKRESLRLQIIILHDAGRMAEAAEAAEALAALPDPPAAVANREKTIKEDIFLAADILTKVKKNDRAVELILKWMNSAPENQDDSEALNFVGYLYADEGKNLDEAEKMIGRALEQKPDTAAYLDSMAWVYFRKGQFEKAWEYIAKALNSEMREDGVLNDHAGDIQAALGNMEKAREYWKIALNSQNKELDRNAVLKKIKNSEKHE